MKKTLVVIIAVFIAVAAFGKTMKTPKPKLTRAKAEAIAVAKAPGKVTAAKLETEHGKQVWSFDIRTEGTKDITEVLVDAYDGSIVAVEHETPAQEKAEKAKEAKVTKDAKKEMKH